MRLCIMLMLALAGYLYGRVQAMNECRPSIEAAYDDGVHVGQGESEFAKSW